MNRLLKFLDEYGILFLFIPLGAYIFNATEIYFSKIIGVFCFIFFGGFLYMKIKKKKIDRLLLEGYGLSLLAILLGIYILNTTESFFSKTIGVLCIIFFSGLIFLGISSIIKRKLK